MIIVLCFASVMTSVARADPPDVAPPDVVPGVPAESANEQAAPETHVAEPAPEPVVEPAAEPVPEEDATPPPRLIASLDDGFGADSADGDYGFRLGALIQYRVQLHETRPDHFEASFQSYNVRPQLRMHAFGQKLRVFVQPELAGTSARLLDLEITYQPHEAFGIRGGQFLTPFSRQYLTPVPVMQFVDFGVTNDFFRTNRDTGVMVYGTPLAGRLEYYVAAFNGNTINRDPNERVRGMGSARIAFSPLGKVAYDQTLYLRESQPFRFSIGLNGYLQRVVPVHTVVDTMTGQTLTVQDPERHNRTVGADLAIFVERFSFLGEIDYRFQRIVGGGSARAFGAYAQMGYYIPQLRLEVSTRIGFVDPSRNLPENTVHIYEGALTGYVHGNHAKIALRYLYADAGSAISGLYVGRQHRLTLATQIFF